MNLRVTLTLINQRQIDVETAPGVHPGDLKALVFSAARHEFGEYDEMSIRSTEEIAGCDPVPARASVKWVRALAVAERRPDLFPVDAILSRQRLYAALTQQGYVWDKLLLLWLRGEAAP